MKATDPTLQAALDATSGVHLRDVGVPFPFGDEPEPVLVRDLLSAHELEIVLGVARLHLVGGEVVVAAADRIAAALAIHRPCHHEGTEPWGCEHGHYDDECVTGIPDVPAVCVACTYDDRTVPYPCPTARALGVGDQPSREDNQHDR